MVTEPRNTKIGLTVKRRLGASREKVFQAWTDPEEMKRWFSPVGFTTPRAEVDLRVGGKYHLTMKSPEGELIELFGTYREIKPPSKLVFTWIIDHQECDGGQTASCETVVTLEFKELENETELTLTHEGFLTDESRKGHHVGWNKCFDHFSVIYETS